MIRNRCSARVCFLSLVFLVAATGVLAFGPAVAGAAYPDRPIRMIVPWAAGGDTDAIHRVFAASMEKQLGKPVVIVNVTGASGTVGAREVVKAAPDGYTVLAVHDFIHTTYYTGVADISYKDFDPVVLLTSTPSVLAAYGKAPWSSMKALIEDARKRPEAITVAATLGSTSHFFPAMIAQAVGIKWKYVSYEGTAPRMTALMGGHVQLGETNLTQLDKVKAGQIKMLAIATAARVSEIQDVPTLKELGIDIVYAVNRGILAPKGTPDAVLAKLEDACAKAAKDPAVTDSMKKQGTLVEFLNRKAYGDFLLKNDRINADLAQALGYKRK
ncbi:MAG: tripartite tricarboxylate transporter substrate binding protein [Deltaproteobacteria bacterium]|nr:tripartite tricarboxylate transporter substrate binding protein [Deltaproteobacteria bacterium]